MKKGKNSERKMKKRTSLALLCVGLVTLAAGALLGRTGPLAVGLVLCFSAALVFVPNRDRWDRYPRWPR